mmetsp:Transcript_2021/g.8043  ORF Transcript_2021/g.8043 Transcript_2021/m.8043 type:complete len:491 (+) Transcript_2021:4242-5714(+)
MRLPALFGRLGGHLREPLLEFGLHLKRLRNVRNHPDRERVGLGHVLDALAFLGRTLLAVRPQRLGHARLQEVRQLAARQIGCALPLAARLDDLGGLCHARLRFGGPLGLLEGVEAARGARVLLIAVGLAVRGVVEQRTDLVLPSVALVALHPRLLHVLRVGALHELVPRDRAAVVDFQGLAVGEFDAPRAPHVAHRLTHAIGHLLRGRQVLLVALDAHRASRAVEQRRLEGHALRQAQVARVVAHGAARRRRRLGRSRGRALGRLRARLDLDALAPQALEEGLDVRRVEGVDDGRRHLLLLLHILALRVLLGESAGARSAGAGGGLARGGRGLAALGRARAARLRRGCGRTLELEPRRLHGHAAGAHPLHHALSGHPVVRRHHHRAALRHPRLLTQLLRLRLLHGHAAAGATRHLALATHGLAHLLRLRVLAGHDALLLHLLLLLLLLLLGLRSLLGPLLLRRHLADGQRHARDAEHAAIDVVLGPWGRR